MIYHVSFVHHTDIFETRCSETCEYVLKVQDDFPINSSPHIPSAHECRLQILVSSLWPGQFGGTFSRRRKCAPPNCRCCGNWF